MRSIIILHQSQSAVPHLLFIVVGYLFCNGDAIGNLHTIKSVMIGHGIAAKKLERTSFIDIALKDGGVDILPFAEIHRTITLRDEIPISRVDGMGNEVGHVAYRMRYAGSDLHIYVLNQSA